MTLAGMIVLEDMVDTTQDLFAMETVNPFLQMDLEQLSFRNVLLQGNQIFVKKFNTSIKLIPGSSATHMPSSIYTYMKENFFVDLCVSPNEDNNKISETSLAVPLPNCQCNGNNYYGMPTIEFSLQLGQYETSYAYSMDQSEFEMLPKVDSSIRGTMCNLGLWNLQESNLENAQAVDGDTNEFAIGQNFIRQFGLTIRFQEREDAISMTVFLGQATTSKTAETRT